MALFIGCQIGDHVVHVGSPKSSPPANKWRLAQGALDDANIQLDALAKRQGQSAKP